KLSLPSRLKNCASAVRCAGGNEVRLILNHPDQFIKMLFVYPSWTGFVLMVDGCRHTDHFVHHPPGTHHPCASEGHMRGADVAASHEQVGHIAAVQTPVGNGVGRYTDMLCTSEELFTRKIQAILLLRKMQIDCPCCSHRSIGIHLPFLHVHLIK